LGLVAGAFREAADVFPEALAVGGLHRADRFALDPDALAPEAHGVALDAEDVVGHQRLVDGGDLLDVEGAVTEALALEDDEAVEDAEDRVVVDARELDRGAILGEGDGGGPAGEASFEEGEGARIEELAATRREAEIAVRDAEENRAEER